MIDFEIKRQMKMLKNKIANQKLLIKNTQNPKAKILFEQQLKRLEKRLKHGRF